MALIEYLLFTFKKSVKELLSRPQGSNKEEMEKAQKKIKEGILEQFRFLFLSQTMLTFLELI